MKLTSVIGEFPYRMALAGGWIDQPLVSKLNPDRTGSMVVVGLEPVVRYMERCGMATGTRKIALKMWNGGLPDRDPAELTRELYAAENQGKDEPSGSQDMIGLIYPGVNRLDYDANVEGGYFPSHIESNRDPAIARWIEEIFYAIPVNQRPDGYGPLGIKNLDREWIRRLGQSGKDCFDAIVAKDIHGLGASMNECMECWEAIFPHTVEHPTITIDLKAILGYYQKRYAGAMYSGCGGGYLLVVSEEPVAGAFRVNVRIK
jgi:hypothetical protein